MKSDGFSQSNRRRNVSTALTVISGLVACGCNAQYPLFQETFAHYVELPSTFHATERGWFGPRVYSDLAGDRHSFRSSPTSPNVLMVSAVDLSFPLHYSENSFVIDTENAFSLRPTSAKEWSSGIPIDELQTRLRMIDHPPSAVAGGFEYRGRMYVTRGDWAERCKLEASANGALVVVSCARRPDGQDGAYLVDIFDGQSGRRVAAADFHHDRGDDFRGDVGIHLHLLDSRWFAISLTSDLRKLLVFDFSSIQ